MTLTQTVCSACLTASCWNGSMYCEDYRTAGTVEVPTTSADPVTAIPGPAETTIVVVAYGRPIPQGSKRHVGRGILVESSNTRPWREAIKQAALDVMLVHDRLTEPVRVTATFAFDRPRGHYRTGRNAELLRDDAPRWPATRSNGDTDKLLRCAFDALVDGGVLLDDSLVVQIRATKVWAGEHHERLHIPGTVLTVEVAP